MEEHALFYNDENGDREYDANSMGYWLEPFFTTGIFNGDMQVLSTGGLKVAVQIGSCHINGKLKRWWEPFEITLPTSDSVLDRIDTIVVKRDDAERDFFLEYRRGAGAQNPTPPALNRTEPVYELQLCEIYRRAGSTAITQADITDTRMIKEVCGWVVATVEEIDFTQIAAQFNSYFSQFKNATEADFAAWFQRMKDQLSTDAAGNLQMQIDDLTQSLTATVNITLAASAWAGTTAPFSQTVSNAQIKDTSNPELYSTVINTMTEAQQKAYIKAYGIVSQGSAITADGSVTFYVWKKPTTDITVCLKGV